MESGSSISDGSEAETGSSLPVSESTVFDETESAPDSETAESDASAGDEDASDVIEAVLDEQMVPVMVSEEYALLLATNQADSMMGHLVSPARSWRHGAVSRLRVRSPAAISRACRRS